MIIEVRVPHGIFSEEDREALASWVTARPLLSTWSGCSRSGPSTKVLIREQDAMPEDRVAHELRYFVDVSIAPGDGELAEHLIAGVTGRIAEFEDDPGRSREPEVVSRVLPLTAVNGEYGQPHAGVAAKCVMEVE